jgi:hypothetical protein
VRLKTSDSESTTNKPNLKKIVSQNDGKMDWRKQKRSSYNRNECNIDFLEVLHPDALH